MYSKPRHGTINWKSKINLPISDSDTGFRILWFLRLPAADKDTRQKQMTDLIRALNAEDWRNLTVILSLLSIVVPPSRNYLVKQTTDKTLLALASRSSRGVALFLQTQQTFIITRKEVKKSRSGRFCGCVVLLTVVCSCAGRFRAPTFCLWRIQFFPFAAECSMSRCNSFQFLMGVLVDALILLCFVFVAECCPRSGELERCLSRCHMFNAPSMSITTVHQFFWFVPIDFHVLSKHLRRTQPSNRS